MVKLLSFFQLLISLNWVYYTPMFFPFLSDTRRYLEVLSCISNRINDYLIVKRWEIDACVIYSVPSSSQFHSNHSRVKNKQCRRIQSCRGHPLPWHHHRSQKLLQFLLLFCFELLCMSKKPFGSSGFSSKKECSWTSRWHQLPTPAPAFAPVRIGGGCSEGIV